MKKYVKKISKRVMELIYYEKKRLTINTRRNTINTRRN